MRPLIVRYLNEIVGLTVMALMAVALVAGQAEATRQDAVHSEPDFSAAATIVTFDEVMESVVFRADIAINLGLDDLVRIEVNDESIDAILKVLDIGLEREK